jgi:hypothetical protein
MTVDLGKVRERMVDLEDHHEREMTVEQVLAELLGHPDAEQLGASVKPEMTRAMRLFMRVYVNRLGLPPTAANAVAVGFAQGVTFAVAYRQVQEGSESGGS